MKFLVLVFITVNFLLIATVNAFPLTQDNETIQKALEYLNNSQQSDGGFGDSSSSYYSDLTPFAIMAIKAANQDPRNWIKNGNSPIDFIKNVSIPALNSSTPPTYYSVVIAALVAAGENPENISGRNLTNELTNRQIADGSFNGSTWITDQEWSILALVAAGYKNTTIVQNATNYLISQQKSDGGFGAWCPDSSSSCPDETALGIMALISAGYEKNSTSIQNAVSRLKQFQVSSGGIDPGWGANIDSDAWVIQAIVSLGNDFSDWIKSNFTVNVSSNSYTTNILTNISINTTLTNYGNNYPFDHLIKLQNTTTGEFNYFKPIQDTSYSIMALLGKPFPLNNTIYNQSISTGVYENQTFYTSINQTKNWDFTASNNTQLNIGVANISLFVFTPADSTGKENTITITVTSSDKLNQSMNVLITVQSLCGNNVCESDESCSICSVDCGGCPSSSGGGSSVISSEGNFPKFLEPVNWGKLPSDGLTKEINLGDKAKFLVGDEVHILYLKKMNSTSVLIEINSTPINVYLERGAVEKIDFEYDGVYDFEITLNDIKGLRANLTLKSIRESYKCPTCPQPGEWSECSGDIQKRANYKCDETTGYSCLLFIEEKSCKSENETESIEINQESSQVKTSEPSTITGFAILQTNLSIIIIISVLIFSFIIYMILKKH